MAFFYTFVTYFNVMLQYSQGFDLSFSAFSVSSPTKKYFCAVLR